MMDSELDRIRVYPAHFWTAYEELNCIVEAGVLTEGLGVFRLLYIVNIQLGK